MCERKELLAFAFTGIFLRVLGRDCAPRTESGSLTVTVFQHNRKALELRASLGCFPSLQDQRVPHEEKPDPLHRFRLCMSLSSSPKWRLKLWPESATRGSRRQHAPIRAEQTRIKSRSAAEHDTAGEDPLERFISSWWSIRIQRINEQFMWISFQKPENRIKMERKSKAAYTPW